MKLTFLTNFFGRVWLVTAQPLINRLWQWIEQQPFYEKLMAPREDGSHSNAYLYKRLFTYFAPYKLRTFLALFITIPIGSLDGAIALSLKPYVDTMQVKTSIETVSMVPLFIVGFTLIQGLLNYLSIYLNGWLGAKIMNDIRAQLFEKLNTLDMYYFDTTSTGQVIQSFFQDATAINTNILKNLKQLLTRFFSSLFLIGVLLMTSWKLAIIAVAILLLVLYPSTHIRKIIKKISDETHKTTGSVLTFYTETVAGARVVLGYNLIERRIKHFEAFQKKLFDMTIKATQAQGWLTPSMHFISAVGIAVIIWQGSLMVVSKELTTGGFVTFLASMLMLYNPIKNLGQTILTTQMSMLAATRLFYTLSIKTYVFNLPGAKPLDEVRNGVQFEDVSFSYLDPDAEENLVLQNATLNFPRGKVTALVGSSGSGKSTIASLIPRFYDVGKGRVCIDGEDVRSYTLESLRTHFAIVSQENFLFEGTVRENLQVAKQFATDDELWRVLDKAYLRDFVEGLELQLDAQIGERGVMLSGGQRQRLAIARAILKDAPIVILDEATSALDNQSEAIVQKALDALMVEKTVIVIAHRLSTIQNADNIVVMDQGRVVEQGTHDDLMSLHAAYAALYQAQFKGQEVVAIPPAPSSEPVLLSA